MFYTNTCVLVLIEKRILARLVNWVKVNIIKYTGTVAIHSVYSSDTLTYSSVITSRVRVGWSDF